jgi:hypothetical protein
MWGKSEMKKIVCSLLLRNIRDFMSSKKVVSVNVSIEHRAMIRIQGTQSNMKKKKNRPAAN